MGPSNQSEASDHSPAAEEEEDDYMTMTFGADTAESETSLQRRARKQREGEIKGHVRSKQEREAEATTRREAALATSIDSTNVGFKMMQKLGYKPGGALGRAPDARVEPIALSLKEDRAGVGLDSLKKRKFKEQWEAEAKRVKVDETDYRERLRQEREDKRLSKLVRAAQRVCEELDVEHDESVTKPSSADKISQRKGGGLRAITHNRPLRSINVVWRGLVRNHLEEELRRRAEDEMQSRVKSLSSVPSEDGDLADDLVYGQAEGLVEDRIIEQELEEGDKELDDFIQLSPGEQLSQVVKRLRTVHHYCFWCKHRYSDSELGGCPGVNEEDHD